MCSEECQDMSYHSKEECSILKKFSKSGNRDQHSPYQLIYPLRFFLLWQNDPMKFSASNGLMDHMEERKQQHYQDWLAIEESIVIPLTKAMNLNTSESHLVRRIAGFLEV